MKPLHLLDAISTLSTLQRWNFLPRIETWVESENIAYVTHLAYALWCETDMTEEQLDHILTRSLLKSLNKSILSDIPVHTRECLKKKDPQDSSIWDRIINNVASETVKIFPKKLKTKFGQYLTIEGSYILNNDENGTKKKEIESLIKFVERKVALEECEINAFVYKEYYDGLQKKLNSKINKIDNHDNYLKHMDKYKLYFLLIKQLKYLRRWNRINRSVETSVLSHTFNVAFLTLFFVEMCGDQISDLIRNQISNQISNEAEFFRRAVLKALFHDVIESLTGDLITPAKEIIEKESPRALHNVEADFVRDIHKNAPIRINDYVGRYKLLDELDDSSCFTVDSIVKACDKIALILECLLEQDYGSFTSEIKSAFNKYIHELQKSEWDYIREFCQNILIEYYK